MNDTIKCPRCASQARLSMGGTISAVYRPDRYDGNGILISQKSDIISNSWECTECGQIYNSRLVNGEIVIKEGWF